MAALLLAACGPVEIELLTPQDDAMREPSPPEYDGEDDSGLTREDAGHASNDAGPAPGDAGLSKCAPGTILCEDFEDSLAAWTFVRSEGSAAITTLDRHTGMSALELSTGATGAFAFFEHILPPATSGTLYLRAFVKLPADQVLARFDLAAFTNAASDAGIVVSYTEQTLAISGVKASSTPPSTILFPRNTWACVELTLTLSTNPTAAIHVDSTAGATLMLEDGVLSDGLARVRVGIVRSSVNQTPIRILFDDLVIGTSPIGCH